MKPRPYPVVSNLVGPQVRRLRDKRGWTQERLAAKCQLAHFDIARGTLAKIESKLRTVTDIEVAQLAKALKVPISELFSKKK